MKKLFFAMVPVLLLTACAEATTTITNSPAPLYAVTASPIHTALSDASNTIVAEGPLTLSRNDLFQLTKKQEYLSVVLKNGTYFEDWSPGPLMGRNWEGEFEIQLSNENGEVKSAVELNGYFNGEMVFNSFFDIDFDDYNGDGNIDFTIGQYASSNGGIFKLFTLDQSGRIAELPIKGHHELFVSGTGRYSTKLAKNKFGFSSTYYDNSIGKDVIQSFVWNGKEFVSESEFGQPTDSEYDLSNLKLPLPKGWDLSKGDRFSLAITDENGVNLGSIVTYPYADDFDFRLYKPNHSEITNEETIDTPIGNGKLYTLDADNGTAASGLTGTHDVYFAVIPIEDRIVYVLEFSKHDKEAASKMQFIGLLNGLQLKK
ncbi:hypothetical protein D3P08_16065 [Paenibacillus nanensis]|uniref:VCBS repeat-containing protein n=1 Tax=Paenibacillus nanensis TaxID=393251 RepID=A0A3A1UW67_9BACL|nr:hypothetical protein [Paenibacillus nanensis]RIX51432.1 hypothetical protein D3P08_16065 [Paenibacillus nanensis]